MMGGIRGSDLGEKRCCPASFFDAIALRALCLAAATLFNTFRSDESLNASSSKGPTTQPLMTENSKRVTRLGKYLCSLNTQGTTIPCAFDNREIKCFRY